MARALNSTAAKQTMRAAPTRRRTFRFRSARKDSNNNQEPCRAARSLRIRVRNQHTSHISHRGQQASPLYSRLTSLRRARHDGFIEDCPAAELPVEVDSAKTESNPKSLSSQDGAVGHSLVRRTCASATACLGSTCEKD